MRTGRPIEAARGRAGRRGLALVVMLATSLLAASSAAGSDVNQGDPDKVLTVESGFVCAGSLVAGAKVEGGGLGRTVTFSAATPIVRVTLKSGQGATVVSSSFASNYLSGSVTLSKDVSNYVVWTCSAPPPPAKATLKVIKQVVNDDGGTKSASDFTLQVTGGNPSPASFAGSAAGTLVQLDAGSYSVTEPAVSGYTASYSAGCTGTIAAGGYATCTVTNNDNPQPPPAKATLTVIKQVVNDNGGTKSASDFTLQVTGGNPSPASFAGSASGTQVKLDAGSYSVTEAAVSGYTAGYSAGCAGTIAAGGSATCTVTNNDNPPPPTEPPTNPPTNPPTTPTTPTTPSSPIIDLSIVKTDRPDPAVVGGRLEYRLVVTNKGPVRATNVLVTDEIPAKLQFVSVSTTQGTCVGGGVVTCALGTLEVGGSALVTIVVRPLSPGLVSNTATVTGAETDSNPADNSSSTSTLVRGPFAPPTARCPHLVVGQRTLTVGRRAVIVARVRLDGRAVRGLRVTVRGAGVQAAGRTNAAGIARIAVRPTRTGIIVIRIAGRPARCGARRVGVVGTFRPPPLTG